MEWTNKATFLSSAFLDKEREGERGEYSFFSQVQYRLGGGDANLHIHCAVAINKKLKVACSLLQWLNSDRYCTKH